MSGTDWTDQTAATLASELAKPNAKIEFGTIKE
jgi:hypothetical protein